MCLYYVWYHKIAPILQWEKISMSAFCDCYTIIGKLGKIKVANSERGYGGN